MLVASVPGEMVEESLVMGNVLRGRILLKCNMVISLVLWGGVIAGGRLLECGAKRENFSRWLAWLV